MSGAQGAQGGAQAKARGKSPIVLIIVVAVLLVGLIVTAMTCSAVMNVVDEYSGSGQGSSAITHEGPKPPISESEAAKSDDTWTVLFYLCGSNLETEGGLATYNLQEIANSDLGDKVTFVVEAGGCLQWQNRQFSSWNLNRAVFKGGNFQVVEQPPAASMAKSETLSDFVTWGTKNYPADHYMIILWDHGGGSVIGVCNDELFPGTSELGDTLTVSEIDAAFEKAGVKFDVVGFDTCLMATIETATKLAPYADFMVASEEVEPGYGWDYVAFPSWLAEHTGTDGNLLGRKICDTYYEKCRQEGVADMATLSVIDLSQMDALAQAFFGVSEEFARATVSTDDLRSLTQGAYNTSRFGSDTVYNMVDLGDLMKNTGSVVSKHSGEVMDAIENAVAYEVHGKSRPNVTGLSVFYPLDTSYEEFFYEYLKVVGNVPYAQFLAVMYNRYDSVNWSDYSSAVNLGGEQPVEEVDMDIKYTERVNSDGKLELRVTEGLENLALVHIELALYLEEENAIVYLGTDHDVGNPSTGVYTDSFNGTWMSIDGNYVCTNLVEHGADYNIYSIPVKLNGSYTSLVAQYHYSTNKYEILCASDDIDEHGMSAKSMRELKEGDKIEFVLGAYLMDSKEPFDFVIGETTYSSSTKMEDMDLGEGAYMYQFVLTDALDKKHQTDYYVQRYRSDGTIVVETLDEYFDEIGR